jgi:hypothetical protein
MWLFFFKGRKLKICTKSFPKKIDDFLGLQQEMWQILWNFFEKILWTMLLGPKFFQRMPKICLKKIILMAFIFIFLSWVSWEKMKK